MREIKIFERVGAFAENKDIARDIRTQEIVPTLEKGEDVVLDFKGVDSATQSFIHALISDVLRKFGFDVLDRVAFKSCSVTVKKLVGLVVEYMQASA